MNLIGKLSGSFKGSKNFDTNTSSYAIERYFFLFTEIKVIGCFQLLDVCLITCTTNKFLTLIILNNLYKNCTIRFTLVVRFLLYLSLPSYFSANNSDKYGIFFINSLSCHLQTLYFFNKAHDFNVFLTLW